MYLKKNVFRFECTRAPFRQNCVKFHVHINKSICIHIFHLLEDIAWPPLALSRYVCERNYLHSVVMIII